MKYTYPRAAKCRICGGGYMRRNLHHTACSPICAQEIQRQRRLKAEAQAQRLDTKRRRESLKTRTDYAKEAQVAVNRYVRVRDAGKPCVSCDRPDDGRHQRHASHYRSVKACSALRFDLRNIHAACFQCNSVESGNIVEYRIRLVDRVGRDVVRWIEEQNHPVRYEVDYLKRLKRIFNNRADRILARRQRLAA